MNIKKIITESLSLINEGKNLGDLYHFTDLVNIVSIVLNNEFTLSDAYSDINYDADYDYDEDEDGNTSMKEYPNYDEKLKKIIGDNKYFMSMSRDSNQKLFTSLKDSRLTLDSNMLSNKYKIIPFNYYYFKQGDDMRTTDNMYNEKEERLISNKDTIPNAIKYIKEISITLNNEFKLDINNYNNEYDLLHDYILIFPYMKKYDIEKFINILKDNNIKVNFYKYSKKRIYDNTNKIILESLSLQSNNNINDNFYKWFGDSKVVEPDGSPMICFHNTNEKFKVFNKGIKDGLGGKGIYFSEYPLPQFGKIQMKVYLKIENPITKETELDGMREINSAGHKTKFIPDIFEKFPQFDGIINRSEIVVKNPNQIKSVDNDGSWDINDDNIYS